MVTMVCMHNSWFSHVNLTHAFIVLQSIQSIHLGRESSSVTLLKEQVVCLSQELKAKAKL